MYLQVRLKCARQESNLLPLVPETNALSGELRARGVRLSSLAAGRQGRRRTLDMDPRPAPNVATSLPVTDGIDEETYLAVLDDVAATMSGAEIPHCFIGGLASSVYGRDRHTHDLDLFVRPDDARRALDVLEAGGFGTDDVEPEWIFKAAKRGLLVDVIFRTSDGTTLDGDLIRHIRRREYMGRELPLIPPEDLLLTKVSAFREDTARQWFDCLAIIDNGDLDWPYLLRRSLPKPHRITALLVWAQGNRQCVPDRVLEELMHAVIRTPGVEAVLS